MANELLNAQPHPSPKDLEAILTRVATSVWVSDTAFGPPVAQVKQSTVASSYLYWLNYRNNEIIHTLTFLVTFTAGSPLTNHQQHFVFSNGYAGDVATPFGVPFWGAGDPILGPAVLTAVTNLGTAGTYTFPVVP
jgi:hypothetical protein